MPHNPFASLHLRRNRKIFNNFIIRRNTDLIQYLRTYRDSTKQEHNNYCYCCEWGIITIMSFSTETRILNLVIPTRFQYL